MKKKLKSFEIRKILITAFRLHSMINLECEVLVTHIIFAIRQFYYCLAFGLYVMS